MLKFFGLNGKKRNTDSDNRKKTLNPNDYLVTQHPGMNIFTNKKDTKGTLKGINVTVSSTNTPPNNP